MPTGDRDSKIHDSQANQKIHLIKNCPVGMIAYKIKTELKILCQNQKIKDVLVIGEARSCKSLLTHVSQTLKDYGFRFVNCTEENLIELNYQFVDALNLLNKNKDSILAWRLLGNPKDEDKDEYLKKAKTLRKILGKKAVANSSVSKLIDFVNLTQKSGDEIIQSFVLQDLKQHFQNLPRPLSNLEIMVCNILYAKGLGADVVFVLGFDQGRLPTTTNPNGSEIYQMLVAVTRAKKRIYFINSVGKNVSEFINCVDSKDLEIEEIK